MIRAAEAPLYLTYKELRHHLIDFCTFCTENIVKFYLTYEELRRSVRTAIDPAQIIELLYLTYKEFETLQMHPLNLTQLYVV